MDLSKEVEKCAEVSLEGHHVLLFTSEIVRAKIAQHDCIDAKQPDLCRLCYCRLFVNAFRSKECLLTKDVSTSYDVTNPLLIRVLNGDHECPIEHKVDLSDALSLREQSLALLQLVDVREPNDDLVCVKAYLREHLVMQAYFLEAQYLVVRFFVYGRLLKLIYEGFHVLFSCWLFSVSLALEDRVGSRWVPTFV